MPIQKLPVFPQWTRSQGQGLVGTMKWVVIGSPKYLEAFLKRVCASHWPGVENTVPTMLQVGAYDEKLKICPSAADNPFSLPHYKETLVVCQYQYLFLHDGWPSYIKQIPYHPPGTTLTLRVRGSGQFLTMQPGAFVTNERAGIAFTSSENCRIVIPITEYHMTCDRLTDEQVPNDLKTREGTVNFDTFLGEKPQTLLMDTWELDPSFVPDMGKDLHRHKITVCVRCRDIAIKQPNPNLGPLGTTYAGWNHDYHGNRWVAIYIKEAAGKRLRYKPWSFRTIFGMPPS